MNFKAYDELRLLGYDRETAAKMAETYQPIGMYEQKKAKDRNRRGNFAKVIGLKVEYKKAKG